MAAVNFNPKNSQQVAHHLSRLIKTESQLGYAIRELESVKRAAIGRFDGIVKFSEGYMSVPYFNQYATEKEKTCIFGLRVSIEKQIAFTMKDYDAPFSVYEVEDFCSFFELDSASMLKAAASEQQYEEWLNHESRSSNY
jgi:hypothetical protein